MLCYVMISGGVLMKGTSRRNSLAEMRERGDMFAETQHE